MTRFIQSIFFCSAFLAFSTSQAQSLRKCVDAQGLVTYTDKLCDTSTSASNVKITENALDGRLDRANVQRFREEDRALQRANELAALNAMYGTSGSKNDAFKTCADQVEQTRGVSGRNKAQLVVSCRGIAARSEQEPSSSSDCMARVNAMQGLSSRQRASAIVGCQGGVMPDFSSSSPPTPRIITSCDQGGCWDNQGGRYNGSGTTMVRNDGRVCQKIGLTLQCN